MEEYDCKAYDAGCTRSIMWFLCFMFYVLWAYLLYILLSKQAKQAIHITVKALILWSYKSIWPMVARIFMDKWVHRKIGYTVDGSALLAMCRVIKFKVCFTNHVSASSTLKAPWDDRNQGQIRISSHCPCICSSADLLQNVAVVVIDH